MDPRKRQKELQSKAEAEEAEKRREANKPDGVFGKSVQYLKNGFLPTAERLAADHAYQREQRRKKEEYEKKK